MTKKPKILICNDDGIKAPGILALWEALHKDGSYDLYLVAPSTERSGAGASITWTRPILVEKIEWPDTPAWAVDGNPADCIKMGITVILNFTPDMIVSGINFGSNAGRNVLHSGTIGACVEGVFRGIPGIAFSCEEEQNPPYKEAAKYAPTFVKYLFENPLPYGSLFNVNFPREIRNGCKGLRFTRQGKGRWLENPSFHINTANGPTYWLGGKPEEAPEIEDCDINLLKQGYITAVPIHVHELTDRAELEKRRSHLGDLLIKH